MLLPRVIAFVRDDLVHRSMRYWMRNSPPENPALDSIISRLEVYKIRDHSGHVESHVETMHVPQSFTMINEITATNIAISTPRIPVVGSEIIQTYDIYNADPLNRPPLFESGEESEPETWPGYECPSSTESESDSPLPTMMELYY